LRSEAAVVAQRPAQPRPPGVPIYVDYVQGGSFIEWSKTLEGVLKLDFDIVIPGHGPVSTKADLVKFKSDLETMRGRLISLIKQGSTKAQLAKILEDDYGWRSTGVRRVRRRGAACSISSSMRS
jgi:glyoxylase-like metal-dependent hydrolase (beta-lactamase superfamily II)